MSMVLPKLWANYNRITIVITERQMKKYHQLIKWRKNASIMEIGYADGGNSKKSLLPYLPSDLKEFVATDISEGMVEYAKEHPALDLMEFDQLDITTKEVPSKYMDRFDHIIGFFVMHMIRKPRQAFRNMFDMLKEGGSIFLTFFEQIPFDEALDRLTKDPEWKKYSLENFTSPYYYSSDIRQEWERDLTEAGFKNYEIYEDIDTYEWLDENEYDNTYRCTCTILPSIPENEREKFLKIYLDSTKNGKFTNFHDRDGKKVLLTNYKMFIVIASK